MSDAAADVTPPEATDPPSRPRPLLSWPPPGLNRMQGDLWTATRELGAGGIILVLPLLWVTASEQAFWSLGPLGEAWWLVLVTSLAGLLIVVTGFVDLFRLLRRSARAQARGYGAATILLVLVDEAQEAGFVLQGSRAFSALGSGARRRILRARIGTALAAFGAAFWLTVGYVAGVLLASRGLMGADALAFFVLLPTALLGFGAAVLRGWEQGMVRKARRAWYGQPWSQDLAVDEVDRWQERARERTAQVGMVNPSLGGGLGFRTAALVVGVVGVCVVAFTVIVSVTSAVSPAMAMISVPEYGSTQQRAARAEFLRRYALPPDPGMTPQEAGQVFHVLSYVGDPEERELELVPSRVYQEPWYPESSADNPTGIMPQLWPVELFPALAAGEIGPEGLAYLERIAAHPAHREMARAAVAPAADLSGARYRVPFPDGITMWQLPIPQYRPLREGAYAGVARGAWLASAGRMAEAERALREVLSAGLNLADEGPFVIDNLVGLVMADAGADGLAAFYDYAGRTEEAATLRWARRTAEDASRVAQLEASPSPSAMLARMPEIVTDTTALRGVRWTFLTTMNTLSPCLNLHRMVFGPDPQYHRWLDEAQASMVRYPGEGEMFELGRAGYFGRKGEGRANVLGAILAIPMGGGESTGSCARLFRAVSDF